VKKNGNGDPPRSQSSRARGRGTRLADPRPPAASRSA
jgi:hypothetical protein